MRKAAVIGEEFNLVKVMDMVEDFGDDHDSQESQADFLTSFGISSETVEQEAVSFAVSFKAMAGIMQAPTPVVPR